METAVDVPDHGNALSPDGEETIMTIHTRGGNDNDNPIRKISNKVQVYQYGV